VFELFLKSGEIFTEIELNLQLPKNISIADPLSGSTARRWGLADISKENRLKSKNKPVFDESINNRNLLPDEFFLD